MSTVGPDLPTTEVPTSKGTLVDAHEELSLLFTLAKRQTFASNAAIAACFGLEAQALHAEHHDLTICGSHMFGIEVSLVALVLFACLSTVAIFAGLRYLFRKGQTSDPIDCSTLQHIACASCVRA